MAFAQLLDIYEIENLLVQMYRLEDDTEYIDLTRQGMQLGNHNGIKF